MHSSITDGQGQRKFVRYQILPVAGERSLSDADTATASPNCLMVGWAARITQGSVKFRRPAQLACAGSTINGGSGVCPPDAKG